MSFIKFTLRLTQTLTIFASFSIIISSTIQGDEIDTYLSNMKTVAPIIKRASVKENRFQAMVALGIGERKDLYNNKSIIVGARYFWSEYFGVESRLEIPNYSTSEVGKMIISTSNLGLLSQKASLLLSSAFLYSPIFGKYSVGKKLIDFDLYTISGVGLRFTDNENQPFLQLGLGVNNYILNKKISIFPEYRLRRYEEKRVDKVVVLDSIFQVGVSWIF